MAKKAFSYRGLSQEELKNIGLNKFTELLPASQRRKIRRGFTEQEKLLLRNLKSGDNIKTHCRDMIIIPEMLGKVILVHNGKTYDTLRVAPEMLGHRLGEFAITRKKLQHSAPGIGATKSSASVSVK